MTDTKNECKHTEKVWLQFPDTETHVQIYQNYNFEEQKQHYGKNSKVSYNSRLGRTKRKITSNPQLPFYTTKGYN